MFILMECCDRDMVLIDSYIEEKAAFRQMEANLAEAMSLEKIPDDWNQIEFDREEDFDIEKDAAWYNRSDCKYDWKIFEIKPKLTSQELSDANTEFVTNWMRETLENDFDVPEDESQEYAEWAYEKYCEGNGETQYQCVELAYEEYRKDYPEEDSDSEGEGLPRATCNECYSCMTDCGSEKGFCEHFSGNIDLDDDCEHIHGEDIKKVYACGTLMGFYNVEKLDSENLRKQVAEKLGYDPEDIRVMDTI